MSNSFDTSEQRIPDFNVTPLVQSLQADIAQLRADLAAAQAARDALAGVCKRWLTLTERLWKEVNWAKSAVSGTTFGELNVLPGDTATALAGQPQPVADAEREALRDFAAQFSDGVFDDLVTDAAGWTNVGVWRRKWHEAMDR